LFEKGFQVTCAVEYSDDLDSARAWQIKDDVFPDWEAAQVSQQFGSLASHPGLAREHSKLFMDVGSEGVCLTRAILGNVSPNFGEIVHGLGAYDDGRHLFGGFAGGKAFSALPLHFVRAPRTRGAAIEAFLDVPAEAFKLQGMQLILPFHEAQSFAHNLAGGVVAAGVDFLTDKLFELRSEIDVQGHG
jgi:hypothetical protein